MSGFVPPYPERPDKPLSAFSTLRLARGNILAIWQDRCFEWDFFSARLLARMLFVCNSPDTVAHAFIERHESFERKSPQMRHTIPAPFSKRRSGSTRRFRCWPDRRCSTKGFAAGQFRRALWFWSFRGCCTGTAKYWEKPDHFMPERFLPENARNLVRHAYVPFSTGPRISAGAAFGLTEAILCLATLVPRVRLRLAPDAVVAPVCRLTLRPGNDARMLVENRNRMGGSLDATVSANPHGRAYSRE